MKSLFLLAVSCIAINSPAFAAENSETKLNTPLSQTSENSLRKMALEETSIVPTVNKDKSSDAAGTNSAMLSLKDPKQEVNLRNWMYFMTLSAQSSAAKGQTVNDTGTRFNLDEKNAAFMPALGLGAAGNISRDEEMAFGWGLGGKVGYSTQNASLTMPNGFRIDDARLNTTILTLNPYLSFNTARYSWLELRAGYLLGTLNYTQTSASDFAKFSRQANFQGANVGANFQMSKRWSVLADYSYRTLNGSTDIQLPEASIEVGTRVIW